MRCRYNGVNFRLNPSNRHPVLARQGGRGRGLLVQPMTNFITQSLQYFVQYHVILDRVVAAPDCTSVPSILSPELLLSPIW